MHIVVPQAGPHTDTRLRSAGCDDRVGCLRLQDLPGWKSHLGPCNATTDWRVGMSLTPSWIGISVAKVLPQTDRTALTPKAI
jgi:hypothetical protein